MANDNQTDNMLTVRQVAHLLHIHPNTLKRWTDKGRLRAFRIAPRGDRRFKQQDIARFLTEFNAYKGDERKVTQSANDL